MIGGGPAGLAVAAEVGRRGGDCVVLERGSGPGASWAQRYDRLRINTSALTSFLPGRRFPRSEGRWPSRDGLLRYYERYARDQGLDVVTHTTARRVDRGDEGWRVATDKGTHHAEAVVVATGKDHTPRIPAWPGRDAYRGRLMHSAEYRNAEPFAGRRVLVVGCGSSALDIAVDLHEGGATSVAVAVRTPPHLQRRALAGIPTDVFAVALDRFPTRVIDTTARVARRIAFGDLTPYGLPFPQDRFSERVLERGMIPTIDPGPFVPLVKRRAIRIVPAVERLDATGAVLAGGAHHAADAIVAATGYDRGLEPLVGHLGVLDGKGHPVGGLPGLHFIGFTDVLTGNLRQIRLDAAAIAKAVV